MQKQGQTGNFFVMHPEAMSQSKQFKPIQYQMAVLVDKYIAP